jgi:hypothetical protein
MNIDPDNTPFLVEANLPTPLAGSMLIYCRVIDIVRYMTYNILLMGVD